MKVNECMTSDVRVANPRQSIREAAQIMAECDAGAVPVGENDRLVGMITDRDIALRAVAQNLPPSTAVREVMSKEVLYCFDDDDVEDIAANMGEQQIRRLPVVSREKRLVGIISLGDLARRAGDTIVGHAVSGISRPGGKHDQVQ
jgi:CBS domain-containing protein